ncbi:MAG: ComF family protein [Dehalococcoidia bacterium]|nr:ComF family protein [Dehalococcoidia bacterium]
MVYITAPLCSRCGRPLSSGSFCADCVRRVPQIDGIRSCLQFDGVVRQMVHSFKYRNVRALAPLLAQFLAEFLSVSELPADALIPVPLHQHRLRERGYNQSQLIARELGALVDMPVFEDVLVRVDDTPTQVKTLNVKMRWENVAGAFACSGRCGDLENRRILLIDDVCTTGATLDACASALRKVGVASVWGLTVAREL